MKILGINIDVYVNAACLIEDGKIIAACPEERLNRQKYSKDFPVRAVEYCLQQARCTLAEIDYIAVGWNPGIHANVFNSRFSETNRWRAEQLYSVPNYLLSLLNDDRVTQVTEEISTNKSKTKIIFVDHHKAHAATFFLSPFTEAAILTCDGRGEEDTITWCRGKGNKIEELQRQIYPQSLGMFYGAVTQFLGFNRDADEWKVMALYSYWVGKGENPYLEKMRQFIRFLPEGKIELDLAYFSYYLHDVKNWYSDKFITEFGEPRKKDDEFVERHYQIAHALQTVTEDALAHLLHYLHALTGQEKLVLSGGTFMNSVFNGKITQRTPFTEVFISSCPDDSGTVIGAALYLYNHLLDHPERSVMTHNYYGPEFSDEYIKDILEKYKLTYQKIEHVEEYTAQQLGQGKLVGWFQGRMEFGSRALGNRSILADPRNSGMKDKLNAAVKYREAFRPFAPSILIDDVQEYFVIPAQENVPFMEKVYSIREDKRSLIPAVTHVDGTGRLQTVDQQTNQRFYRLLSEFKKLTGIPLLLNTSFNLNGEPIVCSPTDAIRTFYACGLDILVLGNYAVEK